MGLRKPRSRAALDRGSEEGPLAQRQPVELRRITLPRTSVNSCLSAEGIDLLLVIVGLSTSAQRHTSLTDGSNDLRKQTQCRGANKENYVCQLFPQSRSTTMWRCPSWGSAFFR